MAYKIEITGLEIQDIRAGGLAEDIRNLISEDKQEDLHALVDNDKLIICSDDYLWNKTSLMRLKHE